MDFFLLEREREVVKGVKGFFVTQGYIYIYISRVEINDKSVNE